MEPEPAFFLPGAGADPKLVAAGVGSGTSDFRSQSRSRPKKWRLCICNTDYSGICFWFLFWSGKNSPLVWCQFLCVPGSGSYSDYGSETVLGHLIRSDRYVPVYDVDITRHYLTTAVCCRVTGISRTAASSTKRTMSITVTVAMDPGFSVQHSRHHHSSHTGQPNFMFICLTWARNRVLSIFLWISSEYAADPPDRSFNMKIC